MKMNIHFFFCFFLLYININFIYSEPIWKISFYDIEDSKREHPNKLNINKGTYRTIIVNITENLNNNDVHLNATLKLNHSELKMFPNELKIDTKNNLYIINPVMWLFKLINQFIIFFNRYFDNILVQDGELLNNDRYKIIVI